MAASSYPEYECTLSPELLKKAQDELNEKPEWRSRDIQALREMVQNEKGKLMERLEYTACYGKNWLRKKNEG